MTSSIELIKTYCVGNEFKFYREDIENWKKLYKDPKIIAMYR